jgi:uncharacterized HAD superfamily protein
MKLGFDIDDTLISLREHAFHIYKKKLGKAVDIAAFHALDKVNIHEIFDLTEEQGKHMWISSMEEIYFTDCPPYPAAIETLQELDKQGHEIYYITARPKIHGKRTMQWMIDKGFPVRDGRFFYGMQDEEKIHIIKELNLDYYFDDKPAVLNTLDQDTLKVYVKDQSYNRHLDIPRIIEWTDLPKIL